MGKSAREVRVGGRWKPTGVHTVDRGLQCGRKVSKEGVGFSAWVVARKGETGVRRDVPAAQMGWVLSTSTSGKNRPLKEVLWSSVVLKGL